MLHDDDDVELLLITLCPVREAMLIPPTFGLICVGDDGGLDGDDFNNLSLSLLLLLSLLLSYPPYPVVVEVFLDLFFRCIIVCIFNFSFLVLRISTEMLTCGFLCLGDVNLYQRGDEDRRCSLLKVAPIAC